MDHDKIINIMKTLKNISKVENYDKKKSRLEKFVKQLYSYINNKKDNCSEIVGRGVYGEVYEPARFPKDYCLNIKDFSSKYETLCFENYVIKLSTDMEENETNLFIVSDKKLNSFVLYLNLNSLDDNYNLSLDVILLTLLTNIKLFKLYNVPLILDFESCNKRANMYITPKVGTTVDGKTISTFHNLYYSSGAKYKKIKFRNDEKYDRLEVVENLLIQVLFSIYFLKNYKLFDIFSFYCYDLHPDNIFLEFESENVKSVKGKEIKGGMFTNDKFINDHDYLFYRLKSGECIRIKNTGVIAILGDVGYFSIKVDEKLWLRFRPNMGTVNCKKFSTRDEKNIVNPLSAFLELFVSDEKFIKKSPILSKAFAYKDIKDEYLNYRAQIKDGYKCPDNNFLKIKIENEEDFMKEVMRDYIETPKVDNLVMGF